VGFVPWQKGQAPQETESKKEFEIKAGSAREESKVREVTGLGAFVKLPALPLA
jgi:hypothetical protein